MARWQSSPFVLRITSVALVLASTVRSSPAQADATSAECIDAHEQAQRAMQDGHLRAARHKLLVCSRETCPKVAQTDCSAWFRDVARDMPTVVVTAKDAAGRDIDNVTVIVDGEIVAEALDGRAVPLDPGPHAFRFESGGRAVEQKVLLASGEQNRRVVVDFRIRDTAPLTRAPLPTSATPNDDRSFLPPIFYVLGGVAVLGAISFTGFAVLGNREEKCVPSCTNGEISDFRQSYLIADISLGVGLASAGAALWVALSKR